MTKGKGNADKATKHRGSCQPPTTKHPQLRAALEASNSLYPAYRQHDATCNQGISTELRALQLMCP